jgi:hypothetical protein
MLVPSVRVVAEVEGAPVASCGRAVGGNGWTRQDRGRHNDTSGDLICRWLEINLSGQLFLHLSGITWKTT